MQDLPYDRQLSYLLARAHRQVHGSLQAILKEKGIPVEQWRILQVLSDGRGWSMGDLAQAVLMNHPAATKTIDRMIMRALVHRRHDSEDSRRVLVFISEFGQDLLAACERDIADYQEDLAARLGARKSAQLFKLLDSLIDQGD